MQDARAQHLPGYSRPPLGQAPGLEELADRFRGRDIVIVGNGPTGRRDYTSLGLPLWVVNGGWQWHAGAELVWMMDDLEGPAWDGAVAVSADAVERDVQVPEHLKGQLPEGTKELFRQRIEGTRAQMEEITRQCPVPIMTSAAYPEKFPQTVAFPLEDVLSAVHPRVYLAETICFAAAWALHIGVKSVSFGGCDYGGVRPAERACLEYWIGRLEQAGIPVKVFPGSQLLNTGPLNGKHRHIPGVYGYRDWTLPFGNGYELGDFPEGTGLSDEKDERLGYEAMTALLAEQGIHSVLDVGCGFGNHARYMSAAGKRVMAIDPALASEGVNDQHNGGAAWFIKADYLDPATIFSEQFDAVWSCHVLEHVDNPQAMLRRMFYDLKDGGLLAITVPPAQHAVVGGHFTLWNAGLLLYHLVRAGFDCREARVKQYGYNLSILVRKRAHGSEMPGDANYSIDQLRDWLPPMTWNEGGSFDGNIHDLNWS